jgi:hypothetical protein
LQTFGTVLNKELHFLLGFQLAVAIGLDGAEMNEHILAIVTADKAVALGGIELLDRANKSF